ncbi:MAG: DUF1893 domain-containing protein [Oscillospiraceae bacterium]|nr:DUF1893 domain-containing protein [Oscillospiraceae bacterium]
MKSDIEKAKSLLKSEGYTCVVCSEDKIYTSTERGVKPLLAWIDGNTDMKGFSAADKVVGKAAAFLYVILGVKAVYADVISEPAKQVLNENGIDVEYVTLTDAIRNRAGTGFCPMETAVKSISEPAAAAEAVRRKIEELK